MPRAFDDQREPPAANAAQQRELSFDPRTVGPRIRMLVPELTGAEARVTTILLRSDLDAEAPLKSVAREAKVSEAMVVKTAKRLGFGGYKELRAALQAYRGQPFVDLHQEVKPDNSVRTIVQKVFRTSIQALEETLAILDMEACGRAAELLHGARQRDFYGLGGSAQIARDVAHKFLRIGIRANVHDDTHMMAMSASLLGAGDVVVAFSHSGRTSGVLELRSDCARQSRQRHHGDQLCFLGPGGDQRRRALLDGAGLSSYQRERGCAYRAAQHHGLDLHRRGAERHCVRRSEPRQDHGGGQRKAPDLMRGGNR